MRPHLATLLEDLRRAGRAIAVVRHVGNRRRVTRYDELARLAGRFAALLAGRGVGPGDRVLLWGENSAEWIAAFYGCMLRGALVVPLDAYGAPEFAARIAAETRPALVVGDAALLAGLPGAWPKLAFEDWAAALPADEIGPVAGLSRETPLQLLFTSGTTGEPKGIVHTHGNVLASIAPIEDGARPYLRYARLVHPLRFLHTLPLSHVFGQTMGLWIPPIFAAEVHFESRLAAPRLIETIRRERISVLVAVPRVLSVLKSHLEGSNPALSASVAAASGLSAAKRWWRFRAIHTTFGLKFWAFVTGGGALPGPVEQFWNALGFVLVQGYGMTETAALITLNHPFHVARGTLGKPLAGREVKLGPDGEVLVRGAVVSGATWAGGRLEPREGEWLATGDLAAADPTGELRFLGRKSEVIVTGSGVNLHPEDLEAAIEQEPEVAACAVVAIAAPFGQEPCAVLALRSSPEAAGAVLERANRKLAEFQRVRRWAVWPEPDLPRTATGKVKRAAVAAWLAAREAAGGTAAPGNGGDWLLRLIGQTTGEAVPDEADFPVGFTGKDLRLAEDLHLDSLGRVQLFAALEERLGTAVAADEHAGIETMSQLRQWLRANEAPSEDSVPRLESSADELHLQASPPNSGSVAPVPGASSREVPPAARFLYPHWPWLPPFRWLRAGFVEAVLRPLVWALAAPRVVRRPPTGFEASEPMLLIANHISSYDVPLLLYALPPALRCNTAVAMSGEMLEDFRHARNLQPAWLNPLGPLAWLLLTAFFNVFPLPRQRGFQRSFEHAGEALDAGFHVVVFPEGTRSHEGRLAAFRPGIGLLAKQSATRILPLALVGLGELKAQRRGWFRSGRIEVRVGEPVSFAPGETEAAITARLHAAVETLLDAPKTWLPARAKR